jgi:hypothetical protein
MKTTTTTKRVSYLGEFGRDGTDESVVRVYTVRGHVHEIRRLWRALDNADAIEQDRIFARLDQLGAVVSQ